MAEHQAIALPLVDLQAQYRAYQAEIDGAIAAVLAHGQFILGPEVAALEGELARYVGARHCVSCASGTDALLLSLMALEIGPDDEVIVPAFSFAATAEAVALRGATPVFCDVELDTFNMDPQQLAACLTERTRAVIPVGLFGQPAQMAAINAIAAERGVPVIEDAAQSFGACHHGVRSCHLSRIGCTSFFPAKPLGCYGDGGALFTDDDALAERLRALRVHGQTERGVHRHVGLNSRLDTIQAAVLRVKLAHLDDELVARRGAAGRYRELLAGKALELPTVRAGLRSSWAAYTVRASERERLVERLAAAGVPTAIYYDTPLHRQQAYFVYGAAADCPVAERLAREVLSLPMHPFLSADDQQRIAALID